MILLLMKILSIQLLQTLKDVIFIGSLIMPVSSLVLYPSIFLSFSDTFHNLMVLSKTYKYEII